MKEIIRLAQNSEHAEQVALMQWWELSSHLFGIPEQLLFAIPNGGQRNLIVARKLKAEGVRAGVPDLFLAVPSMGYNGLFVEMKQAHAGRTSSAQNEMLSLLEAQGFRTAVCHGWRNAAFTIRAYLEARKGAESNGELP